MPTYALYARVSSEEQRERNSIKTQLEALAEYSRQNRIKIRHAFADDGVSGSVPVVKRADGSRMLESAGRDFDVLLVFRMDRIARDALELLRTLKELEKKGVEVRSITEPFETSSPMGRMVVTMLGGMAQMEKDAFRERSFAGMKRGAAEGRWMGGRAPFGYRVEGGTLHAAEAEAVIVREVFDSYLEGESTIRIAEKLNARRVPPPACWRGLNLGAKWHDVTVTKLLRDPLYTGVFRWNKRRTLRDEGERVSTSRKSEAEQVAISVEPVVTAEQFDRAQARLEANRKFSRRNARREFPLRGLVVCGDCGNKCTGGGGTEWPHYSCAWVKRHGREGCGHPNIQAEPLEETVWNDLVAVASEPGRLLKAMREDFNSRSRADESARRAAELASLVEGKAAERGKVLNLLRRDVISEREAEAQLREIERETLVLEAERDRLKDRVRAAERMERSLASLRDGLRVVRRHSKETDPALRGEMIRRVVRRVTVYKDGRAEIEYNLPE